MTKLNVMKVLLQAGVTASLEVDIEEAKNNPEKVNAWKDELHILAKEYADRWQDQTRRDDAFIDFYVNVIDESKRIEERIFDSL